MTFRGPIRSGASGALCCGIPTFSVDSLVVCVTALDHAPRIAGALTATGVGLVILIALGALIVLVGALLLWLALLPKPKKMK